MNKKVRIVALTLSLLFAAVIFSSCASAAADAQAAFQSIMEAFKSCDEKAIDEAYGFTEVAGFIDETSGEQLRTAVISTLSEMEYKVNSAERVSSAAVRLNVEIKTIDFSKVADSFIEKVEKLVESREYQVKVSAMNDEDYGAVMTEKMIEAINEADGEKSVKTLDVTMTKSGNYWKLGGNSEEFLEALFAGLGTVFEAVI